MSKNRTFNAEHKSALKKVFRVLSTTALIKALAEEGNPPTPDKTPSGNGNQINYEQLISQAREEEKKKLYPQIEKLKKEKEDLITSVNNYLIEIGQLKKTIDELNKSSNSTEKDAEIEKLKKQITTYEAKIQELEKKSIDEPALREKIEKEVKETYENKYKLDKFKDEALKKAEGTILPTFVAEVVGNTEEEITKSIESAQAKTLEVKKSLGLVDDKGNPINTPANNPEKNNPPKIKPPVSNPNGDGGTEIDLNYVQNLDPTSKEYAEFRAKMGLR